MQTPRLAYSYIRFSSEQQKFGDSLRRQLALAEQYAAKNNLVLDTQSYRDMGISAYKGKNAVEGKLATFIRGVEQGLIPRDSLLLVESLDRLSRNDVDDALELFLSVIRLGLTIVTLTDNQTYCTESIKKDRGISLIISITVMMRAHEESATKSARVTASWKARTARGGILTKLCPAWLRWENDKWVIDKERAAVIRWIYRMYLKGYGSTLIERQLNVLRTPTMRSARYWSPGVITKILSNKAVYGTMGREASGEAPIDNYYPAIISKDIFERVRLIAKSRSWKGGPQSRRAANFFISRSFCAACGDRLRLVSGSGEHYGLQCLRAFSRAGCIARLISGMSSERALIAHLLEAAPLESVRNPFRETAEAAIEELQRQVRAKRSERDRLVRLALAASEPAAHQQAIGQIEEDLIALYAQIGKHRRATSPGHLRDLIDARQMCAALTNTGLAMSAADRKDLRNRLRELTLRIFERIEFDPVKPEMTLVYVGGVTITVTTPQVQGGFTLGNGYGRLRRDRIEDGRNNTRSRVGPERVAPLARNAVHPGSVDKEPKQCDAVRL